MKSSLALCVLLGAVLRVRVASVPPSAEAVNATAPVTVHNDTTPTLSTVPTTPYPTHVIPVNPPPPPCTATSPSMTAPVHAMQAPATSPQRVCPDGWEVFQGHCYYFVSEGLTWPQAQLKCATLESMLVFVHSTQEYGFLQQLTTSNGKQNTWLGGFYLQDQWLWIDGSWFYNNSWSSVSPDSTNPCLTLSSYEAWSNSPCNIGGYSSICVKSLQVSPAKLCPPGWTGFQGRCYFYNYESLTWPEADTNCAGLQASLVSVHSPQVYFFLYQQSTVNGFSPTWLGGFYLAEQWTWLDGSWFYQGFFTQMSPDNIYTCLSTYSADGWSNYKCDQTFPSFCVKDAL